MIQTPSGSSTGSGAAQAGTAAHTHFGVDITDLSALTTHTHDASEHYHGLPEHGHNWTTMHGANFDASSYFTTAPGEGEGGSVISLWNLTAHSHGVSDISGDL